MRNFPYLAGQGIKGIFKHIGSSLFSLSIMVFTIFLFGAAGAIMMNLRGFVKETEETVGITVFFDEGLSEEDIQALGLEIGERSEVQRMKYTSAEEAWENYKKIYFAGNEHLADGYAQNNPLANSASYEIFLKNIADQKAFVEYLKGLKGIRRVNYSSVVADGLGNVSSILQAGTTIILIVLLVVAAVLISNSIALSISIRSEEIHILRYLGASGGFVRAPLMIEGAVIGLFGALIPLTILWFGYPAVVEHIREKYVYIANIFRFLTREEIFRLIGPVSLGLGLGIGLVGSLWSIKKHLKG